MRSRKNITDKLRRIRRGGKPRTLDLFAGCGGLSLGFHAAGFRIIGAVESDPLAAESHAINFHATGSAAVRAVHAAPKDITEVEPAGLVRDLGLGATLSSVDVVFGGLPFQAFAGVGPNKCGPYHALEMAA